MDNVLFSIIIPFYNCKETILHNISSLKKQKQHSFEVIFVDDCSTDYSKKLIIRELKDKKINYKILKTNNNSGPGVARNIGIKEARGKYLLFIDADDWIEDNTLQILSKYIEEDYDLILFDYYKVYKNKKYICKDLKINYGSVNSKLLLSLSNYGVTRKLIKKEIFQKNSIYFPNWRHGEDIYVELELVNCSKKIIYINNPLYNYFQNPNSISNSTTSNVKFYQELFEHFELIYKEKDVFFYNRIALDLFYNTIILFLKNNLSKYDFKQYLKEIKHKYPTILKKFDKKYFTNKQLIVIYLSFYKQVWLLYILEKIKEKI